MRRFILTDPSGVRVSAYENFPGYDDHLHAEAFIMPKKPLESNATYRVQVDATDENGKEVGKTWTFTTASSDQRLAKTVALRPDVLGIAPTRARSPLRPR